MVTDLTQLSGQQIELSLIHFADILSRMEIWNLQKRYYDPRKDHLEKKYHSVYGGVSIKPKMTRLYKEFQKLEEINEDFEYLLWIAYPDDLDAHPCGITFTKAGQNIFVDIH